MLRIYRYSFPILAASLLAFLVECKTSSLKSQETRFSPIIIEAENTSYSDFSLVSDSSASQGKYLKINNSGHAKWNFKVGEEGYYQLSIRYRSPQGDNEQYLTKNSIKRAVGFAISKDWKQFSMNVHLISGANSILLEPSWGNIDIDYLRVDTTSVSQSIAPRKNIFYKNGLADLTIKVNHFGAVLKTIILDKNNISFTSKEYPFQEDASVVTIPRYGLQNLPVGTHKLKFNFMNEAVCEYQLNIRTSSQPTGLTIVVPHVDHGSSVIFLLSNGKTILVDCAKNWARDSIIIPLLNQLGVKTIDYFFITHYHDDHDSDDKGQKIKTLFYVKNFYDNISVSTGDTMSLDGARLKILNSAQYGGSENERSLSFKLEYNGFVYVHGGDTYAVNQRQIMKQFPNDLHADVFYANHHFHGSVDVEYIRAVRPSLVLIQAQEAIYARSAYMQSFNEDVVNYLKTNENHFIEALPCLEVGTVVIRVNSEDDWTYETTSDQQYIAIPFLGRK